MNERFRLLRKLGQGGFGVVWAAHDRFTDTEVALKLLPPSMRPELVDQVEFRREVASLRLLRLSGVARLLDEGEHGAGHYMAMDLVEGTPFPGAVTSSASGRVAWSELAPLAARLLQVLVGIHGRGLVHCDLKPGNVLVGGDGRVTVVDFGVAVGRALGTRDLRGMDQRGTPAYAAPEQFVEAPVDARADLFSVGVMLLETLVGSNPGGLRLAHDARTELPQAEAAAAFAGEVGLTDEDVSSGLTPQVASLLEELLRRDPDERPGSALEALSRLEGTHTPRADQVPWAGADKPPRALVAAMRAAREGASEGPLAREELAELFAGPERLHLLCSDAAEELFGRTAGDPLGVALELDAWVERGLATWTGRGFAVSRRALNLLPQQPTVQSEQTQSSGRVVGDAAASLDLAMSRANDALQVGRLGLAGAWFGEALLLARAAGEAEEAILEAWAIAAVISNSPQALDRLLFELAPARADHGTDRLALLLEGRLAYLGSDGARAFRTLGELASFQSPRLERCRLSGVLLAARSMSLADEDQALEDLRSWAQKFGDAEAGAAVLEAEGRLHYRNSRFADALDAYTRAAELYDLPIGRLSPLVNAASAALECAQFERCRDLAAAGLAMATSCRSATYAARAEWLMRSASYRAAEPLVPDLKLVDAVRRLGNPDIEGLVLLLEGSIAWRVGELALARELCLEAADLWRGLGHDAARVLALLVAAQAGEPLPGDGPDARAALVELIEGLTDPSLRCQVLALLATTGPTPASWREEVAGFVDTIPLEQRAQRFDVLSPAELVATHWS